MTEDEKYLRKVIREALLYKNREVVYPEFLSVLLENRSNLSGSWWLFEHFAIIVLKKAGLSGDFNAPIYAAKKELEDTENWIFSDTDKE